jgi:HD-GYP domain-containing protein (c-di-GMP phosphodiesterase class II)
MSYETSAHPAHGRIRRLNAIGIALSAQRDQNQLMEMILSSARDLTGSDAGTLYMLSPDQQFLHFAIVQNDTLGIHASGADMKNDAFPAIPLYLSDGAPDQRTMVVWSTLNKKTSLIADVYNERHFDVSGTKAFDRRTGYRSKSLLTVPLCNHEGEVIAALQLLNKLDATGIPVPFDNSDQDVAESLASQAAVALSNRRLIDDMHTLFDRFTQVIASAIDAKSAHTGAHCRRVPDATLMLAEAANGIDFPGLEGFTMSSEDMYELKTAAWLHDCGKVVTPHHVMEKSTKLETIVDRVDYVADRIEILWRDAQIARLQAALACALEESASGESTAGAPAEGGAATNKPDDSEGAGEDLDELRQRLIDDLNFLRQANTGGEFMADEDAARIKQIGQRGWTDLNGRQRRLLNDDETRNLCIRKGTLNDQERKTMEDHMVHTLAMLEQLPFPRHLQRVPEYAGGHHERMDGSGYPRGLKREQMSVPARIMGIADIFEALTAHERPYKKPMPLSQALAIMGRMVENQHLDPDLFAVFVYKKVYLQYAEKHLRKDQIDDVDIDALPGLACAAINRAEKAGGCAPD